MRTLANNYTELTLALDDVRTTLGEWSKAPASDPQGSDTVHYVQLVLQEWIANLQQHADFEDRDAFVRICLALENQYAYGVVLDNSVGFDIEPYVPPNVDPLETLPDRKMGLRIIEACTEVLLYTPTEDGYHRFEFSIPADHDPCLSMPF